ncbi:MAG: 4-alpha-glucanotransferase [Nevskiaceae bacterium]|jgi:4-alpha-glucanotransferase|nr:4-alpha-glucanotransferase [Nevskiaceae bacterium]
MNTAPRLLSRRRAGVLLPVSALLREGQGALGAAAFTFVDWLAEAGFSIWQVLPLVPAGADGSPYWSRSDRAGDERYIDPRAPDPGTDADFAAWREKAKDWLDDYALFEAISAARRAPWWQWPEPLRDRHPIALTAARRVYAAPIEATMRAQWRFDAQWQALRAHAAARGVFLFGDLPIYVAPDSVSTWTSREQFQLNADGAPLHVAGVPPDYFAEDGQLWGNPLYDWPHMQQDGFTFWLRRLRWQAARYDLLRLDHFRGLAAYWSVAADAINARGGEWIKAPGEALLRTALHALPSLELVAEDLGVITPDVTALRRWHGLPGMRVLQFGFDGDALNLHLPHRHEADSVVYTGTHDNDTLAGWYASLPSPTRDLVRRYLGRADSEAVDALRRAALASVGALTVLPMQDLLGLGSDTRLNRPGTITGNWSWRLPDGALSDGLAARYRELNGLYGRM